MVKRKRNRFDWTLFWAGMFGIGVTIPFVVNVGMGLSEVAAILACGVLFAICVGWLCR